jgi:predicted RNA binding protein YcfA (HicA-like mRNA interferase family)
VPKIPGVNHLDAIRALEKAGFRIVRQGKHVVMSDGVRILTIPRHNPVNAFTMGGSAMLVSQLSSSKSFFESDAIQQPLAADRNQHVSHRQLAARCSYLPAAEARR